AAHHELDAVPADAVDQVLRHQAAAARVDAVARDVGDRDALDARLETQSDSVETEATHASVRDRALVPAEGGRHDTGSGGRRRASEETAHGARDLEAAEVERDPVPELDPVHAGGHAEIAREAVAARRPDRDRVARRVARD